MSWDLNRRFYTLYYYYIILLLLYYYYKIKYITHEIMIQIVNSYCIFNILIDMQLFDF